jgi:hypothetical protein
MKSKKCTCCGGDYTPSITSHETYCALCATATEKRRAEIAASRSLRAAIEETEQMSGGRVMGDQS